MKWLALALGVFVLSGCGARVTNIVTPSGKQGFSLNCGAKMDRCMEKAGELCPNGYNIVHQASGTVAVPAYGAYGGVFAAPKHEMAIECK